ncbi:MAG: ABC transporter permease [Pseudomonadales bacterium]|jgi:spermidine/putrescine transport system permease protein|nr:ABC transporter permease [Pseudomonadales bacterium]MDP7358527.1 ABC transporter permease [Pseudomonadales bacterium]MDP7595114.1 ABC transporter permease [Pseudomonadales bacterium]HJN48872.1 ABC transporter permease [Pseudomonadales bacterium]|tara:strand:+ start:465 stop:1523 length:1059 start_codon:yes stop_codon:yes gene_type:complete
MTEWRRLVLQNGTIMAVFMVSLPSLWLVVMIVAPQLMMVDYSLWYEDNVKLDSWEREIRDKDRQLLDLEKRIGERKNGVIAEGEPSLEEQYQQLEMEIGRLEIQADHPPEVYSLKNYTYLAGNRLHRSIFLKTIWSSLLVTVIAMVICYPVAFFLAQVAAGRQLTLLFIGLIIPYWINEILRAFAWLMLLSYNGFINMFLGSVGLITEPIEFLDGNAGVMIGMTYAYVLFMVFPTYNLLQNLDRNQLEAASDLGAGWLRIHLRIAIPHAKPGLAVGAITTFMLAAGTYAVPAILGGPNSLWFTQIIYSWFFDGGNWNQGAAYAFMLLTICILFVMVMMKITGVDFKDITRRI